MTPFGELPMSLQGAYASFIGKSGLTLERYHIFAGPRRLGYNVVQVPTWDESYTGTVPTAQTACETDKER